MDAGGQPRQAPYYGWVLMVALGAHCLTKIFLSSLQADMFPRRCSGLSSKTATSLICWEAGEEQGIR